MRPANKIMKNDGSDNHYQQMMTFSEYVRGLPNSIDMVVACKQYNDFKTNLMQAKVDKFFDEHKHKEWFRLKYHPHDSKPNIQKQNLTFLKRLKIFNDLFNKSYFDNLRYDIDNSSAILNILNAVIILLEDGPEELISSFLHHGNHDYTNYELVSSYLPLNPNSVAIDNLHIDINLTEIEEVCKAANTDLLRLCPVDPYYICGGHLRRKIFAVYKPDVSITDVCWKLSRMKINNHSFNVSINKNLTNRIRTVNPVTNNNMVVVKDIRNAIIIILNLDELRGLYGKRKSILENAKSIKQEVTVKKESNDKSINTENNEENLALAVAPPSPPGSEKSDDSFDLSSLDEDMEKEKKKCFELKFNFDLSSHKIADKLAKNKNPLLSNALPYITDILYDTCMNYNLSRVPKELRSGIDVSIDPDDPCKVIENLIDNLTFSHDENVMYLDKMLWYLRIVHSYDYYNKRIYRYEDELPSRMSYIHVRDSPSKLNPTIDLISVKNFISSFDKELKDNAKSQHQTYLTKDEERYAYRSYKKNILNELESYAERIVNPTNINETVDAYKCKHCTKLFQKLKDVGRHFVSKHRWAIDAIELETDFFNSYLFDTTKVDPAPPKHLLNVHPNRFVNQKTLLQEDDDNPNQLQEAIESCRKLEPFVFQEAPRKQEEGSNDPRKDTIVDYGDISFDDAI